jgi:subtilase family serine protease
LAAGASSPGSTVLTIPSGYAPGKSYVIAKADADGAIPESNEANNTRSDSIVIGPDLIVSALSAPSTAGAGLSIVVTDTTKNQAGGSAPPFATAFYLCQLHSVPATSCWAPNLTAGLAPTSPLPVRRR